MKGIEITLHRNKQYEAENEEDYKVIAGENNATTIDVHFPEEYENYSKRVDFKNIRNEKWTVPLYTPEDQEQEYEEEFDKLNFSFTIPSPVTVNGELQIQFIAYLTDGTDTFVPFEIVKIEVQDSIMYVKKKGSENPDLIIHAFENSNQALEIATLSFSKIEIAEASAINAQNSASESQRSAEQANTRCNNAIATAEQALTVANNKANEMNQYKNRIDEKIEELEADIISNDGTIVSINNVRQREVEIGSLIDEHDQIHIDGGSA